MRLPTNGCLIAVCRRAPTVPTSEKKNLSLISSSFLLTTDRKELTTALVPTKKTLQGSHRGSFSFHSQQAPTLRTTRRYQGIFSFNWCDEPNLMLRALLPHGFHCAITVEVYCFSVLWAIAKMNASLALICWFYFIIQAFFLILFFFQPHGCISNAGKQTAVLRLQNHNYSANCIVLAPTVRAIFVVGHM